MSESQNQLQIKRFVLGPFETNCYVLWCQGSNSCLIIDASFDPEPMIRFINDQSLTPRQLILTHAHVDHIAGITQIRSDFPDLPILIHELEKDWLTDPMLNLSAMMGTPVTAPKPDAFLEHNQILTLEELSFRVRHTPGHSPGSITLEYLTDQPDHHLAIVGDTLFAGSIGRHDFPESDFDTLANSIRTQLYTLDETTSVLPGHGPYTTISHEKRTNPFVRE